MRDSSILELIQRLVVYRHERNWKCADEIRDFLISLGFTLQFNKEELILNKPTVWDEFNCLPKYYYPLKIIFKIEGNDIIEKDVWKGHFCGLYWTINQFENWIKGFTDAENLYNKIFYEDLWTPVDPIEIINKLNSNNLEYKVGIKDFLWSKLEYDFFIDYEYFNKLK